MAIDSDKNSGEDESKRNRYPDQYKPSDQTTNDPRLATDKIKQNISKIPIPNEYAQDYIGYHRGLNKKAEGTLTLHADRLREFVNFLNGARGKKLIDATYSDVEIYITYCIDERENRRSTLNGKLDAIAAVIQHITVDCNPPTRPNLTSVEVQNIDLDEYNGIPEPIKRESLSREEILLLLESAGNRYPNRDRLIICVLYETGVRNSDLRNLELGDVDLDKKLIHISNSKGEVSYKVPIRRDLANKIRHWIDFGRSAFLGDRESDYLFPSEAGEKFTSNDGLTRVVKNAAAQAEIQDTIGVVNHDGEDRSFHRVTPHTLRHSITNHVDELIEDGADELLQLLLGHESEKSKEVYRQGVEQGQNMDKLRTTLHHL